LIPYPVHHKDPHHGQKKKRKGGQKEYLRHLKEGLSIPAEKGRINAGGKRCCPTGEMSLGKRGGAMRKPSKKGSRRKSNVYQKQKKLPFGTPMN